MDSKPIPQKDILSQNYKPHRMRNTFILVTVVSFTCLLLCFVFGIQHLKKQSTRATLDKEFHIVRESVVFEMNDNREILAALSEAICMNRTTQDFWLRGDRDKLLVQVTPLYEQFFQTVHLTHLYFHKPDGTNFLRAHRPPSFGDKIHRTTLQKAHQTGKTAYGMELGPFGTLTFRYVKPWYINGILTGYIELGIDVNEVYQEVAELVGGDAAILLDKKNLIEKNWQKGMEFLQRAGDWDQYQEFVAVARYPANGSLAFLDPILQGAKGGNLPDENYYTEDGKFYQVGAIELNDMTGRSVGYFVFQKDITKTVAAINHFTTTIIFITILIAFVTIFLGTWLLTKIERQFNQEHEYVEERLAAETLQNNIISRFVDYDPKKWDSLVTQSLKDVCKCANASAVYTIGISESERKLIDIHGWSTVFGTEGKAFFEELQFEDVLWWIKMLNKGEPIVITGDSIPDEADVPQKLYERFDTKSILAVPMVYSGQIRGCLLISHREKPMDWTSQKIKCAKLIANVLASAIMRHRIETSVHEYTEKLAQNNIRLKQARAEAEETAKAKSEFLANMSHEIRTPMTAILGFAENLVASKISDEDRIEAADTIYRNGKHLLQLINDILDFSKVEAGQINIEKIACPPTRIINDVILLMTKRAKEKDIFLKSHFLGHMPEEFESDPTRLRQILLNLIGNAIKFTENGGVSLYCKIEKNESDENFFHCEVNDTGIGMNEEQLRKIFQPFTQADSSVTRRYGGTGLGLAISLKIAEAMGGSLTAESTPNVSTTFKLTIPVTIPKGIKWIENPEQYKPAPAAQKEETDEKRQGKVPYRILLAEDGKDNQRLISLLLRKEGAIVEIAENGNQAIRAIEQAEKRGSPFDIVLMDIQMPILDGYSATRRLRQAGFTLPIIALTASVMPEDRSRCLEAGCNDYASKPINRETLFKTITKVIEQAEAPL